MEVNHFQEGKIYKLKSPDHEKYYIGSTIDTLSQRLSRHLTNKKNECSSRELGKNLQIELIENYPCKSRKELNKREGEIQREHLGQIVNVCIAGRTMAEYKKDHPELVNDINTKYKANNEQKVKDEKKKWNENDKEHIKEYNRLYQLKLKEKRSCLNA